MDNQIAVTDDTIKTTLKSWSSDLQFFIPETTKRIELIKSLFLCIAENQDLRACLSTQQGQLSLKRAIDRAAVMGLSMNPQEGKAALVAIDGKVNYWPMKNGLVEIAHESGKVEFIASETVYSGDSFTLKKTAHGDDYDWIPATKNRGTPSLFFAVMVLTSGRSVVKMMTIEQMNEWKSKYSKGLSKQSSAWNQNFNGMAEKTMLKRVTTGVYLGKRMETALELDEEIEKEPINITPKSTEAVADEIRERQEGGQTIEGEVHPVQDSELF